MRTKQRGILICMLVWGAGMLCAQTDSLDDEVDSEQPPPASTAATAAPNYRNFSIEQRLGTYILNCMIPGLGSYAVMHDIAGGTFQVGAVGAQVFFIVTGMQFMGKNDQWQTGLIAASIITVGISSVFNIVRSATYNKPQPQAASLGDPNAWSVAVLPGANGVEQVQLAYTLRY